MKSAAAFVSECKYSTLFLSSPLSLFPFSPSFRPSLSFSFLLAFTGAGIYHWSSVHTRNDLFRVTASVHAILKLCHPGQAAKFLLISFPIYLPLWWRQISVIKSIQSARCTVLYSVTCGCYYLLGKSKFISLVQIDRGHRRMEYLENVCRLESWWSWPVLSFSSMTTLPFNSLAAIFWVMIANCCNHFVWQKSVIASPQTVPCSSEGRLGPRGAEH